MGVTNPPPAAASSAPAEYAHKAGLWYTNIPGGVGLVTTLTPSNGMIVATPLYAPEDITIDRVAIEVGTLGNAARRMRVGIFTDDGMRPDSLLVDFGTYAGLDTTGVKTKTVSQPVTAGRYWWATCLQDLTGTAPQFRGLGAATTSMFNFGLPEADLALFAASNNIRAHAYTFNDDAAVGLPATWNTLAAAQANPNGIVQVRYRIA